MTTYTLKHKDDIIEILSKPIDEILLEDFFIDKEGYNIVKKSFDIILKFKEDLLDMGIDISTYSIGDLSE